ncbi:Peptidoglycan/xylan/chitin deacetylase, PgdA/CDA1 family [Clostridium cavendishii DSM 21758]|uniref:Peptidoglycan/xylan/chitin deacetylase, PgdA/CDA1 family n=1 Tax=Clostridium cavendishii DSM 21758 TaxID=1121302 RepID=A0A1M6EM73_9CLOT|nr:polysaccharide deacetylase family protein [Clostridium cavendishii]SHI86675.1 Peptidoglycan/xylan/chitin deacetylase, PgdA/CDA1 family [Clostridium cavendishii DSM 21758]
MKFESRKVRKKKNRKKRRVFLAVTLAIILVSIGCVATKLYNLVYTKNKVVQATIFEGEDNQSNKGKDIENGVQEPEQNDENNKSDEKNYNSEIIKGKNVSKEGSKYSIDRNEVSKMLSKDYKSDGKKIVFLTFDDGPSNQNTGDVLEILKSKDVKATFFVLGRNIKTKNGAELLKREFNEGHAIGNHSYSHNFKKLYPANRVDIPYFMKEIEDTNAIMKDVLGNEFDTKVVRMPGGHMSRAYYNDPNLSNLNATFAKENISSIDWNSLNGDAEGKKYSNQDMLNYVQKTSNGKEKVVILMHDSEGKIKTKEILPQVIDYFKNKGYEFKTIS